MAETATAETATVGFPFAGFFSRGPRHEAPQGYLTADSRDWAFSPRYGKWKRRSGSTIQGDTYASQAGLLPAKWSARAVELYEWVSPSFTDLAASYAATYTNETGVWGQVYVRDTNGSDTNEVVGGRFASDYPLAGASTPNRFIMPPLWTENALVFTRCFDEKQRRMIVPGSRKSIAVESYRYYPNLQGTPARVSFAINDSTQQGYVQRVFPWGNIPPLYVGDISLPTATTTGSETWLGDDRFIVAWAFRDENGVVGRPTIARGPGAVALQTVNTKVSMNMTGWVDVLDNTSATTKYAYIQDNHIPKGPPGTQSRIKLRTQKVTASTKDIPVFSTLGVVDEIKNNTTTTYLDYNGVSTALVVDPTNIRFADHKWPRRGRYCFSFYGHIAVCGKLKANPAALILAPRQLGGSYYTYDDYNSGGIGTVVPFVAVRENQVANPRQPKRLLCGYDANTPSTGIIMDSTVTLAAVTDTINVSLNANTTLTYGDWKATMVPGVDENVTTDNIQLTQIYLNFTTNSTSTITVANGGDGAAGSLTNVAAGMWITGTNIPAKTYLGTVGVSTCTLVDAAGASVNATGTAGSNPYKVGWDVGDTNPGEFRCLSGAYPGLCYLTKTYLDTLPVAERDVDFTGGDPGHAKYAVNAFYVKNRRSVPAQAGRAMGGGEVEDGALVFYSGGMARIQNTRGGNTNADDDWIIKFIYGKRGTISPEIVQGNGWLARLTSQGIEVSDATRTVLISDAVYDSTEQLGELAYEIQMCKSSANADGNDFHLHMNISDGRLFVSYRSSASVTYPDRYMVYDFSPSVGALGVDEVLTPEGKAYGWSCPHQVRVGAMVEIQKSDGTYLFGAIDANAGATGDGRIDRFESGTTDNGVAIAPLGYHAPLFNDDLAEFGLTEVRARYKKNGTGLNIGVSRDRTRTGIDYLYLPTSGSDDFRIQRLPATLNQAAAKEVLEFVLSDDGTGSGVEVQGLLATYERLQNTMRR